MKILLVDDEQDILIILAELFLEKGHQIWRATSGMDAIKKLREETFCVIISDFHMQNGNGLYLLNYVNKMKFRPVFYFFSALADISQVRECLNAGAKNFFFKPYDFKLLIHEVSKKGMSTDGDL
jgi:DNA-binding NtrC family response regulator